MYFVGTTDEQLTDFTGVVLYKTFRDAELTARQLMRYTGKQGLVYLVTRLGHGFRVQRTYHLPLNVEVID